MKKFLSIFLVLCMVLAAVPAMLLPVMAEGEAEGGPVKTLISQFAKGNENFPSEAEGVFGAGWGLYSLNGVGTAVSQYTKYNAPVFIVGNWSTGVLYANNSNMCLGAGSGLGGSYATNGGFGIGYTADRTGELIVDVSFVLTQYFKNDSNPDLKAKLSVVHYVDAENSTCVWSEEYAATGVAETKTKNDLKVTVNKGDLLLFLLNTSDTAKQYTIARQMDIKISAMEMPMLTEYKASQLAVGNENWPAPVKNPDGPETGKNAWMEGEPFEGGWSFIQYQGETFKTVTNFNNYGAYGNWNTGGVNVVEGVSIGGAGDNARNGVVFMSNTSSDPVDITKFGCGFAYDVTMSGKVRLDTGFTVYGLRTSTNCENIFFSIYRQRDGVMELVYPTADMTGENIADVETEGAGIKYATYDDRAIANGLAVTEKLESLEVENGDKLVYVFRAKTLKTNSWYSPAWIADFDASVTYTELPPAAYGSSVTVGEDLTLNMVIQSPLRKQGDVVGLEYWLTEPTEASLEEGGVELEGTYDPMTGLTTFSYEGLSAKQMADIIYARPFVENGDNLTYGTVYEFSIKQYAESVFEGDDEALKNVVGALLAYGTGAQEFFAYNVENPAEAGVSNAYLPAFVKDAESVYYHTAEEIRIKTVSLILDDKLGYKFLMPNIDGALDYELEFSYDIGFMTSQKIDMVSTPDGSAMKAIVDVSLADAGKVFYVRPIVDGDVGATLTYSLATYYDRVCDGEDDLSYAISSLIQLDKALKAYAATQPA